MRLCKHSPTSCNTPLPPPAGVAFKKTFSYAGFEQQPKSFVNPKILSLNIELELKAEKENAEVCDEHLVHLWWPEKN
jgi:hypothetical protein